MKKKALLGQNSQQQAQSSEHGRRVLFVDDSESFRNAFSELLAISGYGVVEAGSAQEALDVIHDASQDLDLLITDVMMPGMNGHELAQAVRSVRPSLKTLFISGFFDPSVVSQGLPVSERNFLMKPFSIQDLLNKINALIEA